jgi:YhhN-like protein.
MAGLMPLGNRVLGGIAAFGAGHLLYISGLVWYANTAGLEMNAARTAALIVWLAVGTGGWYLVVRRGQQAGILHYAALPYALLLAGTAGTATGLATQQAAFTWTALGAALFLLSDLILAGELFSGLRFRYVGDIVWLTYGPGQMLIVFGTGSALLWVSL